MSNTKTKVATDTPRAAYWRGLVAKWQASGQTPEAFCRQRHVNVGTFVWWRGRLTRAEMNRTPSSNAGPLSGFVEVSLAKAQPAAGSSRYEVALANGRRIGVADDFDEGVLVRLIRVAEGSC